MELKDYLRILRQQWLLIAVVTLVAVAAATAFTLSATPKYQSTSRLFISTTQSSGGDQALQGGMFSQQRVKSYADLLTGEEISRRVVNQLDLGIEPRELADRITAEAKLDTVVLQITVTDTQPKRAQAITQAVSEQFVKYVKELETPPGEKDAPVKASIVDKATSPDAPVTPQPLRNLALATILGLLLGAGGAVLKETLDTSISTVDDLADATDNAPMLGSIYFDKDTPNHPLVTDLNSHAPRVEAFRVLRTNMQFINVDSASKVFVITSSLPGEGKSTTICNLAITLAQSGEKVLLVEADLRRPKAAEYMKLEGTVGVTTVLTGRVEAQDAIQIGPAGLELMAAGSTPPNPAELLQSSTMKNLLAHLRTKYDIILIDAPPLLPVTDAAILASEADGAILVTRHGKTTRAQVEAAVGRLESVGARLLGTVVNMAPAGKRSGYGYGYGYGYAPEVGRSKKEPKKKSKDAKPANGAKPSKEVKPNVRASLQDELLGPRTDDSNRDKVDSPDVHWYKSE